MLQVLKPGGAKALLRRLYENYLAAKLSTKQGRPGAAGASGGSAAGAGRGRGFRARGRGRTRLADRRVFFNTPLLNVQV